MKSNIMKVCCTKLLVLAAVLLLLSSCEPLATGFSDVEDAIM